MTLHIFLKSMDGGLLTCLQPALNFYVKFGIYWNKSINYNKINYINSNGKIALEN